MIWLIATFAIVVFVTQVIQFGADCDQDECTCRDPDAEENKSKTKQMQDAGGGVQWEGEWKKQEEMRTKKILSTSKYI